MKTNQAICQDNEILNKKNIGRVYNYTGMLHFASSGQILLNIINNIANYFCLKIITKTTKKIKINIKKNKPTT